jgi:hypothetical protein
MEDDELNYEIAKAIGFKYDLHGYRKFTSWRDGATTRIVPDYATSVDALAPVEERLRAAGYRMRVTEGMGAFGVRWARGVRPFGTAESTVAPTEARARAEAALAALTHLQPITAEERGACGACGHAAVCHIEDGTYERCEDCLDQGGIAQKPNHQFHPTPDPIESVSVSSDPWVVALDNLGLFGVGETFDAAVADLRSTVSEYRELLETRAGSLGPEMRRHLDWLRCTPLTSESVQPLSPGLKCEECQGTGMDAALHGGSVDVYGPCVECGGTGMVDRALLAAADAYNAGEGGEARRGFIAGAVWADQEANRG